MSESDCEIDYDKLKFSCDPVKIPPCVTGNLSEKNKIKPFLTFKSEAIRKEVLNLQKTEKTLTFKKIYHNEKFRSELTFNCWCMKETPTYFQTKKMGTKGEEFLSCSSCRLSISPKAAIFMLDKGYIKLGSALILPFVFPFCSEFNKNGHQFTVRYMKEKKGETLETPLIVFTCYSKSKNGATHQCYNELVYDQNKHAEAASNFFIDQAPDVKSKVKFFDKEKIPVIEKDQTEIKTSSGGAWAPGYLNSGEETVEEKEESTDDEEEIQPTTKKQKTQKNGDN